MRLNRKFAAAALSAVMAAGATGCTQLEQKSPQETVAVTFGDTQIMLDEVLYYVHEIEYMYESYFGSNICVQDMGDGSGRTVGEYVIDTALTELRQTKILTEYAKQSGIDTLTEEQKTKVSDAVEELMEERPEYVEALGLTAEELEKYYTENAIANIAYLDIVKDVDTTVGEDEFLRKSVMFVKLTPNEITETTPEETPEDTSESAAEETSSGEAETTEPETQTPQTSAEQISQQASEDGSEGEISEENTSEEETSEVETTLSEEELARKEAMEEAAAKILERFEEGEDAADFIDNYNSNTYFSATYSTVAIAEDGTAAYIATAWPLATDECASYTSEDGSIYVLRCLDDNDEEARQSAIDSEIQSRKTTLFSEKYAEIQEASPEFDVDNDVLAAITFTTPLYVAPTTEEASSEQSSGTGDAEAESTGEEGTEEAAAESRSTEESTEAEEVSSAEK